MVSAMFVVLSCAAILPTVLSHKFAVFTSPTLGNFRDLSGLINGLVNFRHDVYLLTADDNRTHPELSGLSRMQRIRYRTSGENPYDERKRYELIYSQQESELNAFDREITDFECSEALTQKSEVIDQIHQLKVDIVIVDADFKCYYDIAIESGLPMVSLASKPEPYLMQTHALAHNPCHSANSILTRINAFWGYLRQESSVASDTALWLWNTNGVVDCPAPTTSNVLQVGGLSHREEQSLPDELDKMFDSAKYGIILFSLPGIEHSPETLDKFLDAFEQVDQTVVFRTNAKIERKLSQNILITSMMSENDLLAHVNVKLMITDADNAKQMDSLFHGVPLISIPLTSSQTYNADRVKVKGHGTTLTLNLDPDELVSLVGDILNDITTTENARKAASILKGSPDYRYIAVYWLDLIARHGADHLKPIQLNTLQFYLVDVIFIMTSVTLLTSYVLAKVIKCLVKTILNRKPRKIVVINEGVQPKPKPKVEIPVKPIQWDTKPKESVQTEAKVETPPETDKSTNPPALQHQGSKKHKKKKNK